MDKREICVIGAGYWEQSYTDSNEIGRLGGIETDQETLNSFADRYPKVKRFLSLDQALREESFLGFTIATPASTHYRLLKDNRSKEACSN